MEEFALAKETDDASVERLEALRKDLADKEEELRGLETRWSGRRTSSRARASCAASSTKLKIEADKRLREATWPVRRRSTTPASPALEKQIAEVEQAEAVDLEPLVGEEVGAEQIADVVEAWTGIPTGKIAAGRDRQAARDGRPYR